ncbi:MAG: hypothetical protein AABY40_00630 [Nanoarchaeota archaeon]
MAYKKTKEGAFMVRESESILGEDIKYASENFKQLEKEIRDVRRIIRNM